MSKPLTAKRLAAAVLLLAPCFAYSAGLGKLTVLSALGQPLSAEIEIVSLQPGEEESLSARLAPSSAFREAAIEFNPVLLGMRFAVEKRGGRTLLRLTTSQPVSEPFLDMLVELSWNTGRLVREYTFLLDPPEYKGPAPIAAAPAPAKPVAAPVARVPEMRAQAPIDQRALAPSPAKTSGTYEVKKGDTLNKIAAQTKPEGVTLQQMLAALYRANPDAFVGNNMNRLRAGRILNVPEKEAAAGMDAEEARRLVASQSSDFRGYQSKLAGAVAAGDASAPTGQRAVSGKITAPAEEPKSAEPRDQVKLSKADPAAKGAMGKAARADDASSRAKALKEAESRVSELEKNVQDLKKLLELKNQTLAELEKKAGAKPAAPAPAPAPAPAAKPEPAPAPVAAAKAPEPAKPAPEAPKPAAEAPKPAADAPKPAAEAPKPEAEAPKPAAEAPKPAAEAPKPKPKPAAPPPPPPPPPSLMDEFLDNPVALGGLGGIALLLGGYGAWAWKRKKASQSKFQDSVMSGTSSLGAASVFSGAAMGEKVDTAVEPSLSSQVSVADASVGGIDTDEVDPIAEADVYMAYGRDAQAEEILKEALGKDPDRLPVHSKLLEIYATRRDTAAFEQTAVKVKDLSGASGADWDKAVALGRSIDPDNALYGGADGSGVDAAALTAGAAAGPALDFDLDAAPAPAATPDITLDDAPQAAASSGLDFDLGGDEPAPAAAAPAAAAPEEVTDFSPGGTLIIDSKDAPSLGSSLDFDLGMGGETEAPKAAEAPAPVSAAETTPAIDTSLGLDFDLGGGSEPAAAAPAPAAPVAEAPADGGASIDFDLSLDTGSAPAPAPAASTDIDLSSISLDLGAPSGDASSGDPSDPRWQEVATKLDLAKAYEEMGDKDGARELLNEVLTEGDAAQQGQAKEMLAKLG